MLAHRVYQPSEGELLYHYCSAYTFQAITSNATLRFTDINMLNDAQEGLWAYSVFEEAATRLIKREGVPPEAPKITVEFVDAIDAVISHLQVIAMPFITCFSLEPDLLGQWRAYADDGRGFTIGFDANMLIDRLPATFLRVLYNYDEQVREMMGAIMALYLLSEKLGGTDNGTFLQECVWMGSVMSAMKHPAFAEEKEVRAIHLVKVEPHGKLIRFIDEGGCVDGDKRVDGNPVSFQVRDNHLVAYTDMSIVPYGLPTPIKKIYMGPKNHSADGNLQLYLGGLGFTEMEFERSKAPYR